MRQGGGWNHRAGLTANLAETCKFFGFVAASATTPL
jgi:hypothetical protein